MAKIERTSKRVATIASKVLNGSKKPTKKEVLSLAGGELTKAPDKKNEPNRKLF